MLSRHGSLTSSLYGVTGQLVRGQKRQSFASSSRSGKGAPSWLPPQVSTLPPAKSQASLLQALSDASSTEAFAVLSNAQARRSGFHQEHLSTLQALQLKRKAVASELNVAGQRAKEAQSAVERLLKKFRGQTAQSQAEASSTTKERALEEARTWRGKVETLRIDSDAITEQIHAIVNGIPNQSHPSSPQGPESASRVIEVHRGRNTHSTLPVQEQLALRAVAAAGGDFSLQQWHDIANESQPLRNSQEQHSDDHLALADRLVPAPSLDMAAGRLATGPSFPYLLGPLAILEQALLQYALKTAIQHGFTLVSAPNVVKTQIAERCGFNPRGGEGGQTYFVHSSSHGADLCLVGTAEISLAALAAGRTFTGDRLPLKMVAISPSFRAEAGGRGADTKGLYRLHQFNKAEMFVVGSNSPGASEDLLEELRSIQQTVLSGLGLTYRVLDMSTEELGASAHRKYDIEAWMPGRGSWGEVSSASNCTDYQSSRLHILQTPLEGKSKPAAAHTLNATLCAVPRIIIALIEQYGIDEQQGRLRLPEVLKSHWVATTDSSDGGVEWISIPTDTDDPSSQTLIGSSRALPPHQQQQHGQHRRSYSTSSSTPPPNEPTPTLYRRLQDRLRTVSARTGTDFASLSFSFLILHELTAILPLLGFFYLLGFLGLGESLCNWFTEAAEEAESRDGQEVSVSSLQNQWRTKVGAWLKEGMQRVERFATRKGWWGYGEGGAESSASQEAPLSGTNQKQVAGAFANAVAAYVLTKVS